MTEEIVLIKGAGNTLHPATDHDAEIMRPWRAGRSKKIRAVNVSERALKFHQRYFAGLIEFTLPYWEPDHLLTYAGERQTMANILKWYQLRGLDPAPLSGLFDAYQENVTERRRARVTIPEATGEQLHRWIKEQAGYYDLERTPAGIVKHLHSINFNSMGQEDFERFYAAAFNVCWVYILSKKFDSENEAQQRVNELLALS